MKCIRTTNAITPVKIMGSIGSGHTSVSIKFRIKSRRPNDPRTREMAPQKAAERSRWARMLDPPLKPHIYTNFILMGKPQSVKILPRPGGEFLRLTPPRRTEAGRAA